MGHICHHFMRQARRRGTSLEEKKQQKGRRATNERPIPADSERGQEDPAARTLLLNELASNLLIGVDAEGETKKGVTASRWKSFRQTMLKKNSCEERGGQDRHTGSSRHRTT